MTKRTRPIWDTRKAVWAAKGGTNRKENPALALPAMLPLEPSPWDDDVPFEPVCKKSTMQLSKRRTV